MNIKLLPLVVAFVAINAFGQKVNHTCSAVKSKQNLNKSATLTVAQIAQTERYDVHFYALDLEMTNQNTSVAGTVEIHGKAKESLDSVWFELFSSFTVSEIRLNGNATPYSRQASAIKVPVNLVSNQPFQIAVDYAGTPPTAATNPLGGAGMSNATSPSWGNRATWSLSEPFSAYEWFPCKQSLTDKADSVSVKVTVPSTCKAGSNGVLENVVDLQNGQTRYEWFHRYPIAYYLISVAVAEYVEYSVFANPAGAPNPILIQNYIYNNPQTLINFQADIDETVDFMEYFSDVFGLYPFHQEKYGHCMAPISGGMEHQTMTTQGFFTNTLTAHELAHQWWGNHVTCGSWADIWVNEGFASYSEYLMLAELYTGDQVQDMLDRHQNIMSEVGGSTYVLDSLNDGTIFSGRLTYDKGAAIVHTLRFLLNNDSLFFQALRNFQEEYAFTTALGVDVQHALEDISGLDLSSAFEQWYFGEGYPTYSARWNLIGSDLHLQVTHTTSVPSVTPIFTNPIEMRFTRPGTTDTIIRLEIGSNSDSYVIPNFAQSIGQVSIDPANWIINKVGSIQKITDLNVATVNELSESKTQAKVYPNPFNSQFSIEIPADKSYAVSIISPLGKVIYNQTLASGIQTIQLNEVAQGYYYIRMECKETQEVVHKLLKKVE
jgi:aminopeptidase N